MLRPLVLFVCFIPSVLSLSAQNPPFLGLWLVERVSVGKEEMTPTARWMRFEADGSSTSGNGWLQSSAGKWHFQAADSSFSVSDSLGLKDRFGPFRLRMAGENMQWRRMEDGQTVVVYLKRIRELPIGPAELLQGNWELVQQGPKDSLLGIDSTHADYHRLFLRWDRMYVWFTADGQRRFGYWQMHAHRPELTLLSYQGEEVLRWRVEVKAYHLVLRGISEGNSGMERRYKRVFEL